jgi:hypothetical protein
MSLTIVAPFLYIDNLAKKNREFTTRIQISTHIPSEQKPKVGKMKLGMDAPEEGMCLQSNLQQSTINICQVYKMMGVCIDIELQRAPANPN